VARRPPRPCKGSARCPGLVREPKERLCPKCRGEETEDRGSASSRGYGALWRKRRAIQLAKEPTCRLCAAAGIIRLANEVDHITPKARGGKDEPSNFQSLCGPCHRTKSAKEGAEGRRFNG